MKQQYYIVILLSILSWNIGYTQDLHSSNYDYNPLYFNPAEAGSFLGTMRIHATHRDQYDAFIQEGYSTQFIQIDMPFAMAFLKRGWAGYSLSIYNDKSGDLGFQNTGVFTGFSYHYPFDKRNKQILSLGFQIQQQQRSLNNVDQANFSDVLISNGISGDVSLLDQFKVNNTNYNIGLTYKYIINKQSQLKLGVASYHLLGRKKGAINNQIWTRYSAYSSIRYFINKRWMIEPRLYASLSDNAHNINFQTIAKYKYNYEMIMGGGLGYRVQDAMQLLLMMEYKKWEVGISYDITISSASEFNNRQGAFEIGLKRIFVFKKTPKLIYKELCPRL
jgi:type IX secretion system PorP/SprF family membrane protein